MIDTPGGGASRRSGWVPDVLGDGFEACTLPLAPDGEGEVVATLVRAQAEGAASGAVLYVHGFNDYFFQADLARWFTERGWSFYGLDLRKYGRSLRKHQTANMCLSLDEYDEELDAAAAQITADGHGDFILMGHSTGGLTGPLWLSRRPAAPVRALVLNSPFLEFKQPAALRAALLPAASAVARLDPNRALPAGLPGLYGESLHASRRGEWDYNLDWKPLEAPVRVGWLRAIAAGHREVRNGLGLAAPTLVLASSRTVTTRRWSDEMHRGDAVLDAGAIAGRAPLLGSNVTILRITDALHDVWLSAPPVRQEAYSLLGRWLDTWAN